MAYILKLVCTKPDDEVWFMKHPDPIVINNTTTSVTMAVMDFDKWNKTFTGYISSYVRPTGLHSFEAIYIFDTEENGELWNTARQEHPFQLAQSEYFSKCNISVVESSF